MLFVFPFYFIVAACLPPRSLLLVILTKEGSVNRTKGKDQNQYHCLQPSFTAPPIDPSFLGMTTQPTLLIADRL
jgi:hypothetical protein